MAGFVHPGKSSQGLCRELNSVEDTALDAANAKSSAVRQGYYRDPYIDFFLGQTVRQIPPMNLGYFVRTLSMWNAITKFHSLHGDDTQVVILGCGYDTLFWRLRDASVNVSRWFDVDLPHVVERKGPVLRNAIFHPLDKYCLVAIDLATPGSLESGLLAKGFAADAPTVFVDECSLIYVDPAAVDAIIRFAAGLKSSGFISYGMIKPDDRFGQLMVQNFKSIGAPLKGIGQYPSVQSHRDRLLAAGYAKVKAVDMNAAMKAVLTREDYIRVRRLEMQDDPDELAFMLAHYVLAIASTDGEFLSILP
jgi:[phosphatase 2A protein]-leucine-carboxy methyltransferase